VDVAGYRDTLPAPRGAPRRAGPPRCPPLTIIVECKQSRSDFLRDRARSEDLLRERTAVEGIARAIERDRIMVEEPELRRAGTSLFPQLDEWDFTASRLPAYRKVLRRLRRIDERLYGQTKFCMLRRYRLADRLFIAAPKGMVRRHELPRGWGLLSCPPSWLDERSHLDRLDEPPQLDVTVDAEALECKDDLRHRLLRNIAVKAAEGRL
jgi:hypothetical protein